jgi:hypothetical protein
LGRSVRPQETGDLHSVIQLYVNFKRLQKYDIVPQGHTVSALSQGHDSGRQGRVGSGCGHGSGRGGGGHGGPNSCVQGLVPQEEIDKMTDIENKHYPPKIYSKFTPAQKAKHWQLHNPGVTPGSGPPKSTKTGSSETATVSVAVFNSIMSSAVTAISELTAATQKRTADESLESTGDDGWGHDGGGNHNNPTLAHQEAGKKPKN